MKTISKGNIPLFVFFILILAGCKHEASIQLLICNPSSINRNDEPVIICRDSLSNWGMKFNVTQVPVVKINGEIVPSQEDDLTRDGKWDELFLLVNIKANDTIRLEITQCHIKERPTFKTRTNIRMAKILPKGKGFEELSVAQRIKGTDTKVTSTVFQLEGPSWENEKVAFRNYLDERNGMDIFGKVMDALVLDTIGINDNYHAMLPWGMDILKVGNSLGAGALAVFSGDTLARAGIPSKSEYQLISEGPLRSIFRLHYDHWKLGDQELTLDHDISIWGGLYGYQSTVRLNGFSDSLILVSGLVNLHADSLSLISSNSHTIMATYDKQAFNGENLGLALIVPNNYYDGVYIAPKEGHDVTSTYCARMKMTPGNPITFRFYACWELSNPVFADKKSYLGMLKQEVQKMEKPLEIKVTPLN